MDALSSPASTLRPGDTNAFLSTPSREPILLRTTSHPPPYPNLSTNLTKPPPPSFSVNPRRLSSTLTATTPLTPPRHRPPTTTVHRRASTGYAAALLDVARCQNATDAVERDSRGLLRALREGGGGEEVVRRVAEEGGLCKQLVGLVRLLVRKGKGGLVGEVMEEFGRLCDEVSGTRVVTVSSEVRMSEEELVGIAEKVRRMSGAMKVKVRHVVGRSFSPVFVG